MENIKIRGAKLEDIKNGLLDIFIEGYRYHQNGRPDIFTIESDEELLKELLHLFETDAVIVITDGNKITGYLSYKIKEKKSKIMDINQLVIKEEYRRHGLGEMLLEEANIIAKEEDCTMITFNCWMFNKSAIRAYDHMGYKRQRIMYEKKLK